MASVTAQPKVKRRLNSSTDESLSTASAEQSSQASLLKCSCCSRVIIKQEGQPRKWEGPAKKVKLEFPVEVKQETTSAPSQDCLRDIKREPNSNQTVNANDDGGINSEEKEVKTNKLYVNNVPNNAGARMHQKPFHNTNSNNRWRKRRHWQERTNNQGPFQHQYKRPCSMNYQHHWTAWRRHHEHTNYNSRYSWHNRSNYINNDNRQYNSNKRPLLPLPNLHPSNQSNSGYSYGPNSVGSSKVPTSTPIKPKLNESTSYQVAHPQQLHVANKSTSGNQISSIKMNVSTSENPNATCQEGTGVDGVEDEGCLNVASNEQISQAKDNQLGSEKAAEDSVIPVNVFCFSCLHPTTKTGAGDMLNVSSSSEIEIMYNSCDIQICSEEDRILSRPASNKAVPQLINLDDSVDCTLRGEAPEMNLSVDGKKELDSMRSSPCQNAVAGDAANSENGEQDIDENEGWELSDVGEDIELIYSDESGDEGHLKASTRVSANKCGDHATSEITIDAQFLNPEGSTTPGEVPKVIEANMSSQVNSALIEVEINTPSVGSESYEQSKASFSPSKSNDENSVLSPEISILREHKRASINLEDPEADEIISLDVPVDEELEELDEVSILPSPSQRSKLKTPDTTPTRLLKFAEPKIFVRSPALVASMKQTITLLDNEELLDEVSLVESSEINRTSERVSNSPRNSDQTTQLTADVDNNIVNNVTTVDNLQVNESAIPDPSPGELLENNDCLILEVDVSNAKTETSANQTASEYKTENYKNTGLKLEFTNRERELFENISENISKLYKWDNELEQSHTGDVKLDFKTETKSPVRLANLLEKFVVDRQKSVERTSLVRGQLSDASPGTSGSAYNEDIVCLD
ncbi:uncharacterized protein LOC108666380 [Hyalella azteca]|uniref:Uncharacterized protein LOC108666380 n=1 Tax=Hyalella azteca TaxID=294128 RepID=A0A8B7N635_HYAAZ|nr:uncharacterized protein LOC108666380 [Hyalella azteca]XP_018008734.1 uncharacterized protein LOC108666380 [Hyalella azteca]